MGEALDKGWRLLLESLEGCGSASDAERRREGHAAAALEVLAREAASTSDYEPFSVPMAKRVLGSDFSFSGLKAQLARRLRAHPPQTRQAAAHVAAAYQKAAIEHVVLQLSRATKQLREERPFDALPAVALVGGVAANEALRQRLTAAVAGSSELHFSPKALCGDNAVMVAFVGLLRREREAVEPPFGFDAGWPLGPHTRERSQLRQS
jgi:N6-L-threonylcarbamoyladenine synthase